MGGDHQLGRSTVFPNLIQLRCLLRSRVIIKARRYPGDRRYPNGQEASSLVWNIE